MQLKIFKDKSDFNNLNFVGNEPFLLMSKDRELFCEKTLRLLPKKRLVTTGIWQNQKVVAKLFFGKKAKIQWEKEVSCYWLLKHQKIQVPELLFSGELDLTGVYAAIFVELYPVTTLGAILAEKNKEKSLFWVKKLQAKIADMHSAGLIQEDLHQSNFLIVSDEIYLVDFSHIEKTQDELLCLSNLALFYANLPIEYQDQLGLFFADYAEQRQFFPTAKKRDWFFNKVALFRWWRGHKLMQKLLRNSTQYKMIKNKREYMVFLRQYDDEEFKHFLFNIEDYLTREDSVALKLGNTCSVYRIKIFDREWVVKKYNFKGFWYALIHSFQFSRALRSWQWSNVLSRFSISVPKSIAFLDKYHLGVRTHSYFISENVADKTLMQAATQPLNPSVVEKTKKIVNQLGWLGIYHGDLKASNFLVNNEQVYLIDFDSMAWYKNRKTALAMHEIDKKRFRRNWLNFPLAMKEFDTIG